MIFVASTPDGIHFTLASERWYEARLVAQRFGAQDAEAAPALEAAAPDLTIRWHGSDANRSGDRHMVVRGEKALAKRLKAIRTENAKTKEKATCT